MLKVVQLFPVSSLLPSGFWFKVYLILLNHNSSKYIQSKALLSKYLSGGKLPYFHRNLILQIRFKTQNLIVRYLVCQIEHFPCYTITVKRMKVAIVFKRCI